MSPPPNEALNATCGRAPEPLPLFAAARALARPFGGPIIIRMTAAEVSALVARELIDYRYDPGQGHLGTPWTQARVAEGLTELRASLVSPSPVLVRGEASASASGWMVARAENGLVIFYDPSTGEFGLGDPLNDVEVQDIRVRGDLVGTYLAA